MASLPATSAASKPALPPRTVRLTIHTPNLRSVTITQWKSRRTAEVDVYWLDAVPSNFGDGFRLTKAVPNSNDSEPDHYDVHLSDEGHTCECRGFLRHGHCKHIHSLVALRDQGKI